MDTSSSGEGTAGEGSDSTTDEPERCDRSRSPFVQPDCLAALRERCLVFTADSECEAADAIDFDDGGYQVGCGWATVVAFASVSTCELPAVAHRCEARLVDAYPPCGDPCATEPETFDDWTATAELELIELCGGPLGPWSAVEPPPDSEYRSCSPSARPPLPEACACGGTACEAIAASR